MKQIRSLKCLLNRTVPRPRASENIKRIVTGRKVKRSVLTNLVVILRGILSLNE